MRERSRHAKLLRVGDVGKSWTDRKANSLET